ncbi:MAG TPA: D-alanyl-D-alanine carboxypeptidase/D-alanyl-D-alanine-endopeptidase [Pseudomonadales bacterium]
MKRLALLLCVLSLAAGPLAAETSVEGLPAPVALAARSLGLAESSISLWVQEVDAAAPELTHLPDVPRNPASTLKLVTTFAALEALGPGYTWYTDVYLGGPLEDGTLDGDLWLRGQGDPYLVEEEYWKLVEGLRRRGVRRIRGDVVFDTTYFALEPEDPGAFDNRPNRVYNLTPHPLLVNFNAVRFIVRPEADGEKVSVLAEPPLPNLELDNRLRLYEAPCGGFQRGVAVAVPDAAERHQVLLEGRFPAGCEEYSLTRTVLHPESYAFGLFDLYWSRLGGEIDGRWRTGTVPAAIAGTASDEPSDALLDEPFGKPFGKPFHRHASRSLGDILRLVNKFSNNVMTRQLALTLGAERFGAPATTAKAHDALFAVLREHGIDTGGMLISNPAGLSRDSRISARQLAAVLQAAWKSPYMPEFVSSLALAGVDGTMRHRLNGTAAEGRMHLKTGTLDHVSAVAGYVLTASGRRLIVVALVNAPQAHRGLGEDLQDVLLRWVVER